MNAQRQLDTLAILILAAGTSSRMRGADKLLLNVDGIPQLRRVTLQALATGWPVFVMLPADDPLRAAAVQDLAVTKVPVRDRREGLSASLRAGYEAAGNVRALMVLPSDLPGLESMDLNAVIAAHLADPSSIHRGASDNQPGHPVILPGDLLPKLGRLTGDQGARDVLVAQAARVRLVNLPGRRATLDLDTPEDWVAWYTAREGINRTAADHPSIVDPLVAALRNPGQAVLAVITSVIGASYRSPGAMMCLFADGATAGNLTNGCIESDLLLHARESLATGRPIHLRYGAGSPFFDIRLPCGGGLEVALYPHLDADILRQIERLRTKRVPFALRFAESGALSLQDSHPTGWDGKDFVIEKRPGLRVLVFGEGPEAIQFCRLVHAAGYGLHLSTSSDATLAACLQRGISVAKLQTADALDLSADDRTAIVFFFHDHDRELPFVSAALNSAAFYVGAQGSRKVALRRSEDLRAMGASTKDLERLKGPIGLIPSSRDPQTLAVSVLAEILNLVQGEG
jgi:xanthine dehydrogenase accessory factor